jgi:hypothetical protein
VVGGDTGVVRRGLGVVEMLYILQTFKFSDYENILKIPARTKRFLKPKA